MKLQGSSINTDKPTLPKRLFWEFKYEKINWLKSYPTAIQRVLEWGNETEWEEIIKYYGKDKVIDTLKHKITFLPDYAIEKACRYFKLQKEDLRCYWRKLARPNNWI